MRGRREKDRIEDEDDDDDENDGPLARRPSLANSKLLDQTHLATAVPTARQLEYQDWEMGIFLHFGIRTFHEGHRDWDGKPMDLARFDPATLNCDQWVVTAKRAGMHYAVLVCKHHDGFANWPSKHSRFTVAQTPWRGGQGDVVREFTDACRRHGLKIGLYYSPAEWGGTRFGDEAAYDEHFLAQITELLEGYGDIDILWFDGCGSEGHTYDWPRIVAEIRRMQPNLLLFNMGDPDFRWVGNESGVAHLPNWNTVDVGRVPVLISELANSEMTLCRLAVVTGARGLRRHYADGGGPRRSASRRLGRGLALPSVSLAAAGPPSSRRRGACGGGRGCRRGRGRWRGW